MALLSPLARSVKPISSGLISLILGSLIFVSSYLSLTKFFVEEIAPIVDEVFILHDQKLKFHDEYKNIHKKGYSLAQIFEELTATRKKMDEK